MLIIWLSKSWVSHGQKIFSRCSIAIRMIGVGIGSGVLAPTPLVCCFARNPDGRPGESTARLANCDLACWVWVDSTLGP